MKFTIFFLLVMLTGVIIYAWLQGPVIFSQAWTNSTKQLLQLAPILIIAVLFAGFTQTLLPEDFVKDWLSDASGWRGILLAWLAGIFTPIAGVLAMPLAAVLYQAGAGLAVIMTFLTSLATLSLIKVPIEVGFYGWKLTAVRFGVSLLLPLIAGALTQALVQAAQIK
ncbi:MAG: hypothetical protein GY742_10480 [Hyphomicrobiales bacterium]|nr:hypothetical protein [Hyphomicrobiales bacterium]